MSKVTVYSIKVNKDTKNDTLSVVLLVSSGEKCEWDKRKNKRIWHRFFCAKDMDSLINQIDLYSKWKNTKYTSGMNVTSKNLGIRVSNKEVLIDKFYSHLYVLSDYKKISNSDLLEANTILEEYNNEKILFDLEEFQKIRFDISKKLRDKIGDMSGALEKFIWHKVVSDDPLLLEKELYRSDKK